MTTKSARKAEYQVLLRRLREIRKQAGLTQVELSRALSRPQSYVSDVERGSRRMDLLQLREFCHACRQDLTVFVRDFESEIGDSADSFTLNLAWKSSETQDSERSKTPWPHPHGLGAVPSETATSLRLLIDSLDMSL